MTRALLLREARDRRALPLVLLHGLLGSPAVFHGLVARSNHPGEMLALELPGHGVPPRPMPSSFEHCVDELSRELPPHSVLVGYSLGGRIALGIAARHPRLVHGVVAVGAHPGISCDRERRERLAWELAQRELLAREGLVAFVRQWEELPLFASQRSLDRERLAAQRATRLGHDPRGIAAALAVLGTGSMPSLLQGLGAGRVPVLMLAGAGDPRFVALAREAQRVAPNVLARVLDGSGHNVVLEAPEALARVVDEQLSRWSPAHPLENSA